MELPTTKSPPKRKSPRILTLFGQSKSGKTTMLSELDDCLIIDTEEGTDFLEAIKLKAHDLNSLNQIMVALKQRKTDEHKYKYIAIDTLDKVIEWHEDVISKEHKVKTIGDIPFGAGYGHLRARIMQFVYRMKTLTDHLILIGHLKKSLIGLDTGTEVTASSLDIQGRLKNILMADSDAIGMVYRDPKGKLMVSFESSGEVEAGSRCEHLISKNFPFDWKEIFID